MLDYKAEYAVKDLFAMQYVLADAIDYNETFSMLCGIYSVTIAERDELIGLLADENIVEIRTVQDYYRTQRIKEFIKPLGGRCVVEDERVEELTAVKGNIMEQLQKFGLLTSYETSYNIAFDELLRKATEGLVVAKHILGIMLMQGIFVTQDKDAALENIRDAADWGNIPTILAYMHFNEAARAEYMDRLYTVTDKSNCTALIESLQMLYGINNCRISQSAKLLEEAFIAGTAKRDVCSPQQLRILCGSALTDKDKGMIILSTNKELVSAAVGLPLNLRHGKIITAKTILPVFNRVTEAETIARRIDSSCLRGSDFLNPICLVSQSKFIRDAYINTIEKYFTGANVVRIAAAMLLPFNFDSTENNVFVRSCNERMNNIYIIELTGEIDERIIKLIRLFAAASHRRAFPISRMQISIDLSPILPIFICDRFNAKQFCGEVHKIEIADVTDNEKKMALKDLSNKMRSAFRINKLTFDDGAVEILLRVPIDTIEEILTDAVLAKCGAERNIRLSAEEMQLHSQSKIRTVGYGFGGRHAK